MGNETLFDIVKVIRDLGPWVLPSAFVYLILESSIFLGLILPGEIVVVFIGALAGQDVINFPATLAVLASGTIAGDNFGFLVGAHYGDFVLANWPWMKLHYERHERQITNYLERWGILTILVGRLAGLEALVPFICGMSGLRAGEYFVMTLLADTVWAGGLCVAGYLLGREWRTVAEWLEPLGGGLMAVILAAALWLALSHWRRWHRSS